MKSMLQHPKVAPGKRASRRSLNGWIVIDKPVGLTSTQVVERVRAILGQRKVGHGGTLDPAATGVLPVAMGEATKTVSYVMDGAKTYRFRVRWGEATNTDDREGEIVERSDARPGEQEIRDVLPTFVGEIEQVPPQFSAIKVSGQRAYELARGGVDFELKARQVVIRRFELIDASDPDHAEFEVACGKGTYMRALARDLGRRLGTCAHIDALRRVAVGPFSEEDAISLDTLEELRHSPAAAEQVLPVEAALVDIPAFSVSEAEASQLRRGQSLAMLARIHRESLKALHKGDMVFVRSGGSPVALARYEDGSVHPVRVLKA